MLDNHFKIECMWQSRRVLCCTYLCVCMCVQLAYYRQFQCCAPTYESCSTAAFKHGRTETIRPASRATKACVEAFDSSGADSATLMSLIIQAAAHHSKLTKEAATGCKFCSCCMHYRRYNDLTYWSWRCANAVLFWKSVHYKWIV